MNQYIYDEITNIKNLILPPKGNIKAHRVLKEYIVVVNDSIVSQIFACAVISMTKEVDSIISHFIIEGEQANIFIEQYMEYLGLTQEINPKSYATVMKRMTIDSSVETFFEKKYKITMKKVAVFTFLYGKDERWKEKENREQYLEEIETLAEYTKNCPIEIKMVHSTELPSIQPLPGGMTSISEREYEVYCSQFGPESPEQLVLDVEEILRNYVKQNVNIVATRMDTVFGPAVKTPIMEKLIESMEAENCIYADSGDKNQYIGLNYIRFAASVPNYMLIKGRRGNIYHLQQYLTTPYDFVMQAYTRLSDYKVEMHCRPTTYQEPTYSLLCTKKIANVIPAKYSNIKLALAIYKTVLSCQDWEYFDKSYIFRYDGKLDQVKKIEIEMMEEVKRICEKYQIKYFLVGGSLLGAVRHQGFIPWDDDLDVGMLREDFEKFRKVAPGELNPKYAYQSYRSEESSHYIFDKIRLKDTFFCTKFSNMFKMENGLFIDILVYDKTAKSEFWQKKHIRALHNWARVINVRWVNKPRKNIAYKRSVVALPFMRLFPFRWYHNFFEFMLKWYKNSNSEYVIDGVGQNILKGAFPLAWVEEVIDAPFEDTTFPIPKEYDAYLRHWYGDHYMELLPVSQRNSGHILKRIDLGCYAAAFGFEEKEYHHASQNGELYDYFE